MTMIQISVVCFIAALHLYLMYVEMFAWEERGPRFLTKFDAEFFEISTPLAKNMGLYNGFLAVGLLWSQFFVEPPFRSSALLFFLSCIAVAGIVGAVTADRKILFLQSVPAFIGIGLVLILLA